MGAEIQRRWLPPPWIGHLLVFGLLFAMVLSWFFFQTRQAQQVFVEDTREHVRLLANAIGLHARGALAAESVTDAVLVGFLASSARFVDYLNTVEPFRPDELSGFADETGLSMIRIISADSVTQGPRDWNPGAPLNCDHLDQLIRMPSLHTVAYGVPRDSAEGCVLVGMDSRSIDALQTEIGLPRALEAVSTLPGVIRVQLDGSPNASAEDRDASNSPTVVIRHLRDGRTVAEAVFEVAGARLLLDMDAGPLLRIRERLWLEFLGFFLILTITGGAGTWLLYRHQTAHDRQLQDYERRLSQQREEAGLGRAAASIAHEIRNPLNTMAMGLQRLQFEAHELTDDHRRLIAMVLEVKWTPCPGQF